MICLERSDNSLLVVAQSAHAVGCEQLARRWLRPVDIPLCIWPRFITAVREHDSGWQYWEHEPQLDDHGHPYTFTNLPNRQHIAVWKASIETQAVKDVYAALVVALHARWLFTHISDSSEEDIVASQQFIADMDDFVDRAIDKLALSSAEEQLAIQPGNLTVVRRLLAFLDLLSLMLIGGLTWRQWGQRMQFGDRTESLWLTPDNGKVVVDPWPFEDRAFDIQIDAKSVPDLPFENAHHFLSCFEQADPVLLQYRISPD